MSETADALVVFGITGDLARRMTIPALYRLTEQGLLTCSVIGVGRRAAARRRAGRAGARVRDRGASDDVDEKVLADLLSRLTVHRGRRRGRRRSTTGCARGSATASAPVFYLATPPSMFLEVAEELAGAGLADNARLVVEKPFGSDLASARELNERLTAIFPEDRLYRIDHFLGKEPVQDIIYLRFANALFEPVWSREDVDSIQITLAEDFGVEGRGVVLRQRRGDPRRRSEPSAAGACARGDGASVGRRGRDPAAPARCLPGDAGDRSRATRCSGSTRGTGRSRASRRSPTPRPSSRCASRSRTGAGRASRSSSAPGRRCRSTAPRSSSGSSACRSFAGARIGSIRPAATTSSCASAETPGSRSASARRPRASEVSQPVSLDLDFNGGDGRAAASRTSACSRTRCAETARCSLASRSSRRRGASCSRSSTPRRRSSPTSRGTWGPRAPSGLAAEHGGWRDAPGAGCS